MKQKKAKQKCTIKNYKKTLKIDNAPVEFTNLVNSLDVVNKNNNSLKYVISLTKNNANNINKLIKNDPTYKIGLAEATYKNFNVDRRMLETNKDVLYIILREIDIDNSTQMFRFDKSLPFDEMINYIQNPNNHFFDKLLDPQRYEYLPDDLASSIVSSDKTRSLPSKICKYLLEFLSGNNDKYFISDKVVRKMLIVYLDAYGIKHKLRGLNSAEKLTYKQYFDYLKALQIKINQNLIFGNPNYLTKHDIDHIIWYSYKSLI